MRNQSGKEFSDLSKDVYRGDGTDISNQRPPAGYEAVVAVVQHSALSAAVANRNPLDLGLGLNPSPASLWSAEPPLRAVIYVNHSEQKIIPGYRGTDNTTNIMQHDRLTLPVECQRFTEQVHQAALQVQQRYPNYSITPTGHSLGAGMATYHAVNHNLPATVFCTPGIGRNLHSRFSQDSFRRVTAYQSNGDPVSALNTDPVNVIHVETRSGFTRAINRAANIAAPPVVAAGNLIRQAMKAHSINSVSKTLESTSTGQQQPHKSKPWISSAIDIRRYQAYNPFNYTPFLSIHSPYHLGHSFNTFPILGNFISPFRTPFSYANYLYNNAESYNRERDYIFSKARIGLITYLDTIKLNFTDRSTAAKILLNSYLLPKLGFGLYSSFKSELSHFSSVLSSTGLISSYNSLLGGKQILRLLSNLGVIGGVETKVGQLEGFEHTTSNILHNRHVIALKMGNQNNIFSNEELRQILRELAIGIYIYDTLPFFSLHFNDNGYLYPVIHPAYENTLVGEVISLLDYLMKGYLNGGVYELELLKNWHHTNDMNRDNLRSKLIDLKNYFKQNLSNLPYVSLREMMVREGLESKEQGDLSTDSNSIYGTKFKTSFRIIAKTSDVSEEDGIFVVNPTFKVKYSVDLMPDYQEKIENYRRMNGTYPEEYQKLHHLYQTMAKKIHEEMPMLPICRDYFQMLHVICFSAYYFKTMKNLGKMPVFEKTPIAHPANSPKAFPPVPVRYYKFFPIKITLRNVVEASVSEENAQTFQGNKLNILLKNIVEQNSLNPGEALIDKIEGILKKLLINQIPEAYRVNTIEEEYLRKSAEKIIGPLMGFAYSYKVKFNNLLNRITHLPSFPTDLSRINQLSSLDRKIASVIENLEKYQVQQLTLPEPDLPDEIKKVLKENADESLQHNLAELEKVFQENVKQINQDKEQSLKENEQNAEEARKKVREDTNAYLVHLNQQKAVGEQEIAKLNELLAGLPTDEALRQIIRTAIYKQYPQANAQAVEQVVNQELPKSITKRESNRQQLLAAKNSTSTQLVKIIEEIRNVPIRLAQNLATIDAQKQAADQKIIQFYNNKHEENRRSKNEATEKINEAIQNKLIENMKNAFKNVIKYYIDKLKKHLEKANNLVEQITKLSTIDINLLERYRHSMLDVADSGFYQEDGDNFKIIGGCSMQTTNIKIGKVWPSDKNLLLNLSSMRNTKNALETFNSDPIKHNGEAYMAFTIEVVETSGDMEEYLPLLETLTSSSNNNQFLIDNQTQTSDNICLDPSSSEQIFNIHAKDHFGNTILHKAAEYCDLSVVSNIIQKQPSLVNTSSSRNTLPIHVAASEGNTDVVSLLLKISPTQLNSPNQSGETPLMTAAQHGHTQTVKLLLEHGANINVRLMNGLTALWKALINGFEETACEILKSPAIDLTYVLDNGENVLHEAIKQKLHKVSLELVSKGTNVLQRRKTDGKTPWHLASENNLVDLVKIMIESGKVPNLNLTVEGLETQTNGTSSIHLAVKNGNLKIINLLIKYGSKINFNQRDHLNRSALDLAMDSGHEKIAITLATVSGDQNSLLKAGELRLFRVGDVLIKKGLSPIARINDIDYLYYLIIHGEYLRIIQLKIQLDKNIKYQNHSLVALAAQHKNTIFTNHLISKGYEYSTNTTRKLIHWMVAADDIGFLKSWIIKHDIGQGIITEGTENGKGLAYLAAENGSLQCLGFLLKHYLNNISTLSWNGKHILEAVIRSKKSDIFETILPYINNFDIIINNEGYTPATLSAELGLIKTLEKLVKCGANILRIDQKNRNCLEIAIFHKDIDLLKALSTLTAIDSWPKSILNTARLNGNNQIFNWIYKTLSSNSDEFSKEDLLPNALHAIRKADAESLEQILDQNVNINTVIEGYTLLAHAIREQQYLIISNLIARQASADFPGNESSALFQACSLGDIETLHKIFNAGLYKYPNPEIFKILPSKASENLFVLNALNGIFSNYLEQKKLFESAIHHGDYISFDKLVKSGFSTNRTHIHDELLGETPLSFALLLNPVLNGFLQLALEEIDIKIKNKQGKSLIDYVLELPAELVKIFLSSIKKRKDEFTKLLDSELKSKPSLTIKLSKDFDLITLLDEQGYLQNFVGFENKTILHLAVLSGNLKFLETKLNTLNIIDQADNDGLTPLMLAAIMGNEILVKFLLSKNANPNITDRYERNALIYAVLNKHTYVANFLVSHTENLDLIDRDGFNVAMYAARENLTPMVRLFVANGISTKLVDKNGLSALHFAAMAGNEEITDLLINSGDLNNDSLRNLKTPSPLQLAARNGHLTVCYKLLKAGADPSYEDENNFTAIDYSLMSSRPELIDLMKQTTGYQKGGRDIHMIRACCFTDNVTNLRLLLNDGCNVNAVDQHGRNALYFSSIYNSVLCAKLLLEHGCNPTQTEIMSQETSLSIAAKRGNTSIVRAISSYTYPNRLFNRNGYTPLIEAILNGKTSTVLELIQSGANINETTSQYQHPNILCLMQSDFTIICTILLFSRTLPDESAILNLPDYQKARIQKQLPLLQNIKAQWEESIVKHDSYLHLAIRLGCVPAVHLLLEREPCLLAYENVEHETAISLAEKMTSTYPAMKCALLKYSSETENQDFDYSEWIVSCPDTNKISNLNTFKNM
ncbi:MAG: ankyrin repeat domain-containing protein [Gammaproteobacteria bacterium]